MDVELVKTKNYEDITKIYAEEFSKEPYNENWTVDKALKKFKIFSKYCDIFEIKYSNIIVGVIVINTNFWDIDECVYGEDIAIKKEFQNKGIGKLVFEKIFEYYKKKGYKKFYGVIHKERINFYEKLGLVKSKDNIFVEKDI